MGDLVIEQAEKSYGAVRALSGVSLSARGGEIHGLLGENGAGKSTLIKILSGATSADAGRFELGGVELALGSTAAAGRAGVRTVFQELSTIPHLSVAENLFYGAEPTLLGVVRRRRLRARARELLADLGLERIDVAAPVDELALGDRQLLEAAKALRSEPTVLVLDEATSALSTEDSAWVLRQARRAASAGAVVLLITHRLDEVRRVADRLTVLRGGRDVLTGAAGELSDEELIAAMLGRRVERLYPERNASPGERVLEVRGLRCGRTGPLDLHVRAGEVLGIGGLQGQGQRALMMALAGAAPWSGEVELGGRPYAATSPQKAIRRGVALVPEDRQQEGLFLGQDVRRNLTAAALDRFARLAGVLDGRRELAAARRRARQVGVAEARLPEPVSGLSGGNQQKVVLGKALMCEPQVLLLYDCTRGVDIGTKADIFQLIADLAGEGVAILFYSSDLSELTHVCDRVAVMVEGAIRGTLGEGEITEGAILRLAVGSSAREPRALA